MEEFFAFIDPIDDLSLLSFDEIRAIKSNHLEIKSIRRSKMAVWVPIPGFPLENCFFFVVGQSSNSRFLIVALNYDADGNRLIYHQIKLADEDEIKRFWCR